MELTNPVLFWPFIVYAAAVLLLVAGMMVTSYFLGMGWRRLISGRIFHRP